MIRAMQPALTIRRLRLLATVAVLAAAAALRPAGAAEDAPLRLLVVTGGHGYDTNEFRAMFTTLPGIEPRFVAHPEAHAWLAADRAAEWDVLVMYDMWQPITPEVRRDFRQRIEEGKGLVALHHSLVNYQDWPLYAQIVGGRYHLEPWDDHGEKRPASTYLHDVDLKVQVLNRAHPLTLGMADFSIHDETYGGLELKPTAKPLLATQEPTSSPVIAWVKTWQKGRVAAIQLGHDKQAYQNPAYRRLLKNAIRWTAHRD